MKKLILLCFLIVWAHIQSAITVRAILEEDFAAIVEMSIRAFAKEDGTTTPEKEVEAREVYQAIFSQEAGDMKRLGAAFAGFVACHENNIIAYASAQEAEKPESLYVRWLAIDPAFQKQGLSEKLIGAILTAMPHAKTLQTCTTHANTFAQKMYADHGGMPATAEKFAPYLYSMLNPADFTGFFFTIDAVNILRNRINKKK
jgi:ribosomal protein S18 acetylase RimI-like enzyme